MYRTLILSAAFALAMNAVALNAYERGQYEHHYQGQGGYEHHYPQGNYQNYHRGGSQQESNTVVVPENPNYNNNNGSNWNPNAANPQTQGAQIFDQYDQNNR